MARLGLTIRLNAAITLDEAVAITTEVQDHGFMGATFAAKGNGSMVIYHTESLRMSGQEFEAAAIVLVDGLKRKYAALDYDVQKYIIYMPRP